MQTEGIRKGCPLDIPRAKQPSWSHHSPPQGMDECQSKDNRLQKPLMGTWKRHLRRCFTEASEHSPTGEKQILNGDTTKVLHKPGESPLEYLNPTFLHGKNSWNTGQWIRHWDHIFLLYANRVHSGWEWEETIPIVTYLSTAYPPSCSTLLA